MPDVTAALAGMATPLVPDLDGAVLAVCDQGDGVLAHLALVDSEICR